MMDGAYWQDIGNIEKLEELRGHVAARGLKL